MNDVHTDFGLEVNLVLILTVDRGVRLKDYFVDLVLI